jgi:hypothetical protein
MHTLKILFGGFLLPGFVYCFGVGSPAQERRGLRPSASSFFGSESR